MRQNVVAASLSLESALGGKVPTANTMPPPIVTCALNPIHSANLPRKGNAQSWWAERSAHGSDEEPRDVISQPSGTTAERDTVLQLEYLPYKY